MIRLRGITWDHTRGYTPLVACAQRFHELNPDVVIDWQRRSLREFGETPVDLLAREFDLLVVDHPFIGYAARHRIFLPLDPLLPAAAIRAWHDASVGASARSYVCEHHIWAAPIDTACPVAVWHADRLAGAGAAPPRDWEDLLRLAARGLVLIPGVHTDAIHHFYMLCLALGEDPGSRGDDWIPAAIATEALRELARLYELVPAGCRGMNPIAIHEKLASPGCAAAYCPFAYGYSNYSRRGFSAARLSAGPPPVWKSGAPLRTSLGGTGLAIAAGCRHVGWAARFVDFVAAGPTQRGLYWQAGGQPAHRDAWTDPANNLDCADYLRATLPALDAAWLRPRFPGYLHFQDHAAHAIHAAACGQAPIADTVARLGSLWHEARLILSADES